MWKSIRLYAFPSNACVLACSPTLVASIVISLPSIDAYFFFKKNIKKWNENRRKISCEFDTYILTIYSHDIVMDVLKPMRF
jgi:hypothetical protein